MAKLKLSSQNKEKKMSVKTKERKPFFEKFKKFFKKVFATHSFFNMAFITILSIVGIISYFFINYGVYDLQYSITVQVGEVMLVIALIAYLFYLWAKQGFIRVPSKGIKLAVAFLGLLIIKFFVNSKILSNLNLFDALLYIGASQYTFIYLLVAGLLLSIVFINKNKDVVSNFILKLEVVSIVLVFLGEIIKWFLSLYQNKALVNGGIINYVFKSLLVYFSKGQNIISISSVVLGGVGLATSIFLGFFVFWSLRQYYAETKKQQLTTFLISSFWLLIALLIAMQSTMAFVVFIFEIILFLIVILMLKMDIRQRLIGIVQVVFQTLILLVFALFVNKVSINKLINAVALNLKYIFTSIASYVSILENLNKISQLVYLRLTGVWNLVFGFPVGSSKLIIRSANYLGLKVQYTSWLVYLLEFGLLFLVLLAFIIYTMFKLLKFIKEGKADIATIALFPIIVFPLFIVPSTLGWILWFVVIFIVYFEWYKQSNITLGLYKLGAGSRKASGLLINLAMLSLLVLGVYLSHAINLLSSYHYVNAYYNKWVNANTKLVNSYLKWKKEHEKDKKSEFKLDKNSINEIYSYYNKYNFYLNKFDRACSSCNQANMLRTGSYAFLYSIDKAAPNLVTQVYRINTSALKYEFISTLYQATRYAVIPNNLKQLGFDWYALAQDTKQDLFMMHANNLFSRYLVFSPYDAGVLTKSLDINMQALTSELSKKNKGETYNKEQLSLQQQRVGQLINMLTQSGILYLQTTGNLDVLLTATIYRSQYYRLLGDMKQAKGSFDTLVALVKGLNIKDTKKQEIIKQITQIKNKLFPEQTNAEQKSPASANPAK